MKRFEILVVRINSFFFFFSFLFWQINYITYTCREWSCSTLVIQSLLLVKTKAKMWHDNSKTAILTYQRLRSEFYPQSSQNVNFPPNFIRMFAKARNWRGCLQLRNIDAYYRCSFNGAYDLEPNSKRLVAKNFFPCSPTFFPRFFRRVCKLSWN